jgi:hypothetical protein
MPAPISAAVPSSPARIFMPTPDQLRAAYTSIADAAEKNGTARQLKHAPAANMQKYPNVVLSHGVDAARVAYVVKGQLYINTWAVNPKMGSWEHVGAAPLF